MSERHVRRLNGVRDEFLASTEAPGLCLSRYDSLPLRSDEEALERAAARLSDTYIVRLTAEMEGMLFHRLSRFPSGALGSHVVDRKMQAADLLNLSEAHPKLGSAHAIQTKVRQLAGTVFDYWNGVAHGGRTPKDGIDFAEAHTRLVDFVRRLEDASDV